MARGRLRLRFSMKCPQITTSPPTRKFFPPQKLEERGVLDCSQELRALLAIQDRCDRFQGGWCEFSRKSWVESDSDALGRLSPGNGSLMISVQGLDASSEMRSMQSL